MTNEIIQEILDLQRTKNVEPYMTEEGWTEFWRLVADSENTTVDKTA